MSKEALRAEAQALVVRLRTPRVTHHQVSGDWEPYATATKIRAVEAVKLEAADMLEALLRAELEAGGEAVAQPTGVERMEQALRDQEAHFEVLYASPVAADTQGDAQ